MVHVLYNAWPCANQRLLCSRRQSNAAIAYLGDSPQTLAPFALVSVPAMEDITGRVIRSKALGGKRTLGEKALKAAQSVGLPVAVGLYFLFKWWKAPKKAKAPAGSAKEPASTSASTARKARREYKINREEAQSMLAQDGEDAYPEVDPGDDTVEAYNEDETEAAGAAAANGAPPNQMIEMLKS